MATCVNLTAFFRAKRHERPPLGQLGGLKNLFCSGQVQIPVMRPYRLQAFIQITFTPIFLLKGFRTNLFCHCRFQKLVQQF